MQIRPISLLHPLLDQLSSTENFFNTVKEQYNIYKEQNLFGLMERPAVFVYQIQKGKTKVYNGIVAATAIEDYWNGKVKGHEATLEVKELQQLELLKERKAQVKPILLTYPKVKEVERWILAIQRSHRLFSEVEANKSVHRLWRVDGSDAIAVLQQLFAEYVPQTYIADGHHRTAVMSKWAKEVGGNPILYCTLFASDQIGILPFNRVIDGVEERSLTEFLKEMETLCDIRKISRPFVHPPKHCLQMYVQKQWYALIWKPEILATYTHKVERLDPYLLDQTILKQVMNIQNIRESDQVKYVGGLEGSIKKMKKLVDSEKDRIGFYLPPVRMDDFIQVVNEGELLPPKSTWFEPRMLNGLLVYDLSE